MIDLKQCSLGIELGSTRIKAVLVGDTWKSGRVCRLPTRHWLRMCWPSVASR